MGLRRSLMYTDLLSEYDLRRKELRTKINQTKKTMQDLSKPMTTDMISSLDSEVLCLHANQKKIEAETKNLKDHAKRLTQNAEKWVEMYDSLNDSLKQLGDVVNWAEVLERDMQEVSAAVVRLVTED